ncbi:MAG TPA: transposase [Methylotenera sp.]|nr:transposase [Methylotenera sp.]
MPRLARFVVAGHPQNILIRGHNGMAVFNAEADYCYYLNKLAEAAKKHQCDIHAYVLMPNHIHLLATPHKADGLAKMMQILGRDYGRYFNATYQHTGSPWEGRYRASLVDGYNYALFCYCYIEQNPIRAGLAQNASDYPWSSYRSNALGKYNALITQHDLYLKLGKFESNRLEQYCILFEKPLELAYLAQLRDATNMAWAFGTKQFKLQISSQLNRRVERLPKGGDRKSEQYKQLNANFVLPVKVV